MNQYEYLKVQTEQLTEMLKSIPPSCQEEVFLTLFRALKNSKQEQSVEDEIRNHTNDGKDLLDAISSKEPSSNLDRTLVFAYVMDKSGIKKISMKHVECCYSICDLKVPGNLVQNLRDASGSRYRYLDFVQDHYEITKRGIDIFEAM